MEDPIVTVAQGKLKGTVCQGVLGPTYLAFKGIPFAAPPVGELRFKDPQPAIPWSGVRDASKCGGTCAQFNETGDIGFVGSEDCLYLNVYTPLLTKKRPVMVWIHGGSFITGGGDDTRKRPDYLITKDITLVTLNYRLGALGFLNLNDKIAPGNQGLKDAIAALQWVKKNIANFGGDSDNITIFGDSAGGVMVHCLTISPAIRGQGLFHKAISQSGLLACYWAQKAGQSKFSFRLASFLGAPSKDPEEIVKYLRTLSCNEIVNAQKNLLTATERSYFQLAFGCVIDNVAEQPVLPLPLDDLLGNDENIPYIMGHTSDEFLMFSRRKSEEALKKQVEGIRTHVEAFMPIDNPEELSRVVEALKKHYFEGKPLNFYNQDPFIEFYTELHFGTGLKIVAENRGHRKCASTYVYKYSYYGNEKCTTDLILQRIRPGASHVDESCYLFYTPLCKVDNPDPPAEGTRDRATIERLTRMWTNFAKTGNPTPVCDEFVNITWEPNTEENNRYLDIGDDLEMKAMERGIREIIS